MSKKKGKTAVIEPQEYIVLATVTDKDGKDYLPGVDTVRDGDFPAAVIDNWLGIVPPVLKVKEVEVKDVE